MMFVSVAARTTSSAWAYTLPFPVTYAGFGFLAFSIALFGFTFYFHMGVTSEADEQRSRHLSFQRAPIWLYFSMICLFALQTSSLLIVICPARTSHTTPDHHRALGTTRAARPSPARPVATAFLAAEGTSVAARVPAEPSRGEWPW